MKRLFIFALFFFFSTAALAQAPTKLCITTNGSNCIEIQGSFPFPVYQGGANYTNVTTSTDTVLKAAPGTLQGFSVNTAGTAGSSAVIYDGLTCTGTKIGTFSTTAQNFIPLNAAALIGICVTTISSANLTFFWR